MNIIIKIITVLGDIRMSKITLIATLKNNNKTYGYRFLNFESLDKYETVDIGTERVIATIRNKGNGCIQGIELDNGKLKGSNGSLDRYGVVDNGVIKSSPVVILSRIIGADRETLGYDICGTNGKVLRYRTEDVMKYIYKYGVANGKVVSNGDSTFISSINGNYSETEISRSNDNSRKHIENTRDKVEESRQKQAESKEVLNTNIDDSEYKISYSEIGNKRLMVTGIEPSNYSGEVIIPKSYGGKVVSAIGYGAFKRRHISGIKISENITDIGQDAFYSCRYLKQADLSRGKHKFIAANSFASCVNLERISIGNDVEKIHESAFKDTRKLKAIRLGGKVETIAKSAFFLSGISEVLHTESLKRINDSAFEACFNLKEFDFTGVNIIGTCAFMNTKLEYAIINKSVSKIGRYAFYNCKSLANVNIEEGVIEIGEHAFDSGYTETKIKELGLPRTLQVIGNSALGNVETAYVYHGTVAENYCIGNNTNIKYIDKLDNNNSSVARQKSSMLGISIPETILEALDTEVIDIRLDIDESKLVHIKLNNYVKDKFQIGNLHEIEHDEKRAKAEEWRFRVILNYLTNTHNLYTEPFERLTARCMDLLYVDNLYIHKSKDAAIIKSTYIKKDNLEHAEFIIAVYHDELVFICEYDNTTDIVNTEINKLSIVPLKLFHVGDTIGNDGVVAGEKVKVVNDVKLGNKLEEVFMESSVVIRASNHETYNILYGNNQIVKIADMRTYDKDGRVRRGTPNYLNIMEIIPIDTLYSRMRENKKRTANKKLFSELMSMSDLEVESEKIKINTVFPESISEIYVIAKELKAGITGKNIDKESISPEIMSIELFRKVANTYWMIEKDIQWLKSAGRSSLNIMATYNIEGYVVEEYLSNQVVKFYNPYMSGGKGVFIFVLKYKGMITGVYASRLRLSNIVNNLYDIVDYDTKKVKDIMTDAKKIDILDADMFFKFYDVVQKDAGWALYGSFSCDFAISVYKPTGTMYFVVYDIHVTKKEDGVIKRQLKCMPIFKIGDIDRALEVAGTTNVAGKARKISDELTEFVNELKFPYTRGRLYDQYIKARELTIVGESRTSEYEGLINDRLALMIGTKSEKPMVYGSAYKNSTIEYDDSEGTHEDKEFTLQYEVESEDITDEEYSIDTDGYSIEEEYYEESEDESEYSVIDMIKNMSKEELSILGLTEEQRDDMINKVKRGELKA